MGATSDHEGTITDDPSARGGLYALVDVESRAIIFVGRSADVRRRLDWWHAQEGGGERYRGVVILHNDDSRLRRVLEHGAIEKYGTLGSDRGAVPGRVGRPDG